MSKGFDYSKWDNIELSDDEDDVHPNIDRESWFRMKHRSRVEREEREEVEKKKIGVESKGDNLRIEEITRTLASINNADDSDDELEDVEGLEAELLSLQKHEKVRIERLDEMERNRKWNVDNMCEVVEDRSIVNPKAGVSAFSDSGYALPDEGADDAGNGDKKKAMEEKGANIDVVPVDATSPATTATTTANDTNSTTASTKKKELTSASSSSTKVTKTASKKKKVEPSKPTKPKAGPTPASIAMLSYHEFTEKYAKLLEEFMLQSSLSQSRDFLIQHGDILLQENAANYLLLASLEDEMNGLRDKMKLTARQSQLISNIVELAKSLKNHPGNVIVPFFKRMEEKEHLNGFMVGCDGFVQNLIKRAVVKRKEIDDERAQEEEEGGVNLQDIPKEERLGPGGLDPVEVFESLPVILQEAFESRDTDELKKALVAMPPDEAELHMKRCVDAGLWNQES